MLVAKVTALRFLEESFVGEVPGHGRSLYLYSVYVRIVVVETYFPII